MYQKKIKNKPKIIEEMETLREIGRAEGERAETLLINSVKFST
jgi:hypothetical protein